MTQDIPQAFIAYKQKNPEYFRYPDGSEPPIDRQIRTWEAIEYHNRQKELGRQAELKKLDAAVEAKSAQPNDDAEWKELVHPRKVVITQKMRELLRVHHENVALAHILNEIFGTEAEDKGDIRYDKDKQSWVVWNGKYWVEDPEGIYVIGMAERLLFDMMIEASILLDASLSKQISDTQGSGAVKAALTFLKPMVAVSNDAFDLNPNLINLDNGTYNVTTGELYPHKKNDYITKIAGVEFDPKATCEKWEKHLQLVIPDASTRLAFQVYMGHALVAGNPENAAMFAYGGGKNGKTETFAAINMVLKEYSIDSNAATFTERFNDDAPRPDLARMKGARLITVPEGKQGRRLDEGVLKNLTGGSDAVTARFLYGREFSFRPTGKLCFHTNHLPKITGRDNGIWRRIYPIPFVAVIPKEKQIPEYSKILYSSEGSGIFNWLVKGYKYYKVWGSLIYTSVIDEARVLYKDKEDVLGDFFEHYKITGDEKDIVSRAELYQAYKTWSNYENSMEKPYTKNKFNDMVEERVGSPVRHMTLNWVWKGIRKPEYNMQK